MESSSVRAIFPSLHSFLDIRTFLRVRVASYSVFQEVSLEDFLMGQIQNVAHLPFEDASVQKLLHELVSWALAAPIDHLNEFLKPFACLKTLYPFDVTAAAVSKLFSECERNAVVEKTIDMASFMGIDETSMTEFALGIGDHALAQEFKHKRAKTLH